MMAQPAILENIQHVQQIKRITWIGLVVNLLLSGLKFVVGVLGASQAVIADAVHSLSDMSTDFAVIFGVKYWSAPPDEEHPYGHGRIEALVTTFIGAALAAVALGIAYKALATIRDPDLKQPTWIALTGPLLSIVLKEALYRWTVAVGSRVRSSAVIANAWHHRSDALSSLPALIAVIVSILRPQWAFVDHIGALVVSLFILKVSWNVLSPSLAELIDRGATKKERERIGQLASGVDGVREVHAIRTRRFGFRFFVDLHILVDPEITVRAGHDISEEVKQELINRGPEILDVVVHLEPDE